MHVEMIDGGAGRILVLMRRPARKDSKRCVLFVPPFAEEMNKCRRQIAITGEMLAQRGLHSVTVDLYGTGDSEGEFGDATWEAWCSNIAATAHWIAGQGLSVQALVAVRVGCLLATEFARRSGTPIAKTAFWQPVENGKQFVAQFLRLRIAAGMMEEGRTETVESLRKDLASGQSIEVAGYELSPGLWQSLESLKLSSYLTPALGSLGIFEVGPSPELSPIGRNLLTAAQAQGITVSGERIEGDPFWLSSEIVVNQQLSAATVDFVAT